LYRKPSSGILAEYAVEPPNMALELTPLCGPKIAAILKNRITLTAFPTYQCGAAQRQAVGRAALKHEDRTKNAL
jgi:hypothetical protein